MSGMGFRKPSGGLGDLGGLDMMTPGVKPVEMKPLGFVFKDPEQAAHDDAIEEMTEEEKTEMEETLSEEEADEEAEQESDDIDQEEKDRLAEERRARVAKYICYCGNPHCMIGFRQGLQVRNDNTGMKDRYGIDLPADAL